MSNTVANDQCEQQLNTELDFEHLKTISARVLATRSEESSDNCANGTILLRAAMKHEAKASVKDSVKDSGIEPERQEKVCYQMGARANVCANHVLFGWQSGQLVGKSECVAVSDYHDSSAYENHMEKQGLWYLTTHSLMGMVLDEQAGALRARE